MNKIFEIINLDNFRLIDAGEPFASREAAQKFYDNNKARFPVGNFQIIEAE